MADKKITQIKLGDETYEIDVENTLKVYPTDNKSLAELRSLTSEELCYLDYADRFGNFNLLFSCVYNGGPYRFYVMDLATLKFISGFTYEYNLDGNSTLQDLVDLINYPEALLTDTNTWRKVQLNGTDKLGTDINTNPLNIKAGNNMTITESNGTFTFSATDTNTDTKVTAVGNHYTPSSDTSAELTATISGTAGTYAKDTEYTVLTGVKAQRDAKGHVTGITYTAQKIKDTNTTYTIPTVNNAKLTLKVGNQTVSGNDAFTANDATDTTYNVPSATADAYGVVKVSSVNSSAVIVNSESTTVGRYYPVELNSDGKAIVNVPWTDTLSSADAAEIVYWDTAQGGQLVADLLDLFLTDGENSISRTSISYEDNFFESLLSDIKAGRKIAGIYVYNDTAVSSSALIAYLQLSLVNGNTITFTVYNLEFANQPTYGYIVEWNSGRNILIAKTRLATQTDLNSYATQIYVDDKIADIINSAPEALDTLGELATALEDHEDAYDALLQTVGEKANSADLSTVATSGSYNDLSNKPTIPTNTNQTIKSGTTTFGANDVVNIVAGNNVTITPDATNKKITISSTDTNTNTTYDLSAAKSKSNGSVTLDLTAGGSGSGTDSVTIKGTGATTVTTDANGVITINSTDNNTDTHYTNYLQINGNGTEAIKYTQDSDKTLNLKPGSNVSISAASGEITINATDTNTWRPVVNNLTSTATDSSLSAAQGKALNDKFADYLPKSGGSLYNNATLKFTMYDSRTVTISGNSIDADMSADEGTWAGNFATLKHSKGTTAMLGWYGSKDNGLYHIFMGGPYNDPAMKMDASGNFTFKNTITGTITNATQLGGVDASSYLTSVPTATSSTLGGVKIGSNITVSSGTISLTKANVTSALGYTPPTADNNTTYTFATGDANGQIKVTPSGGSAQNISVKGLGSAAYTASTAYAAGNHTHDVSIAASSGTNELTLAHGTKYALTAGGQSFIFTMPSDNNTDTKVTQTQVSSSTYNKNYPLLMAANDVATTSSQTTTAYKNYAKLYANPYSGQLTASSFYASSDRRLKENIKEFNPQKSILELPIVEFDFKDTNSHQIGCIAQDLQEICPELVNTNENGYLSIAENKLVYLCILEIKKLKAELEALKMSKE